VVEVAEDRWPRWAAEQAGTSDGPSAAAVLLALALVALVLIALLAGPEATAEGGGQVDLGRDVSLCEEHAGRPGWDAICREARAR
jgi:hypothetical protein